MTRHLALSSAPEASVQKEQTWHHPGGKLVELGPHTLKQDELLAIIIGSGVAGRPALTIANSILDDYVGLYGIYRTGTVDDLAKISGLGRIKASRILAAIELGRRLHKLTKAPQAPVQESNLFPSAQPIAQTAIQPQEQTEVDLLAEIIGSGIRGRTPKDIAGSLLAKFGSFLGLFGQDMGKFLAIKGLNSVKVIRIAAAMEIAKRVSHAIS